MMKEIRKLRDEESQNKPNYDCNVQALYYTPISYEAFELCAYKCRTYAISGCVLQAK